MCCSQSRAASSEEVSLSGGERGQHTVSMKAVTVRLIRVGETLSSLSRIGNSGKYMLLERGPKNAIQVTIANVTFFLAGEKAV